VRPHAFVAMLVGAAASGKLLDFVGIGEQSHLHFVDDRRESSKFVQQDGSQVFDAEPGIARFFRDAQPHRIAWPRCITPSVRQEGMDVALEDGFNSACILRPATSTKMAAAGARLCHVRDLGPTTRINRLAAGP